MIGIMKNIQYDIKDIALAPEGERKIAWVREAMPLLRQIEEWCAALPADQKPFAGVRISLSVHMEAKTAYLTRVLTHAGAAVCAMGCNVLSTQDDVAAALAAGRPDEAEAGDRGGPAVRGVPVFAVHGESEESYWSHAEDCLAHKPNLLIDDGGDLVHLLHTKRPDLAAEMWGGCEETTTGVIRLKALAREGRLRFPMIAVNDARCKHLFDNRYGTGQSVWDSVLRNTNLIIASKTVVVAGYGWCGRGIAMRAAGLGAQVIVTEIDPVKAMEARMDGYSVMTMFEAAPHGDIFLTATGCKDVITTAHMALMRDGAILGNAGHFNVEIDIAGLSASAVDRGSARNNIETWTLPGGKRVHVIAEGKLLNIAAADGHPAEIMDLSFAVQFHSALYMRKRYALLAPGVYDVSEEIDGIVSRARLAAWGIEIDELTEAQKAYLESWEA